MSDEFAALDTPKPDEFSALDADEFSALDEPHNVSKVAGQHLAHGMGQEQIGKTSGELPSDILYEPILRRLKGAGQAFMDALSTQGPDVFQAVRDIPEAVMHPTQDTATSKFINQTMGLAAPLVGPISAVAGGATETLSRLMGVPEKGAKENAFAMENVAPFVAGGLGMIHGESAPLVRDGQTIIKPNPMPEPLVEDALNAHLKAGQADLFDPADVAVKAAAMQGIDNLKVVIDSKAEIAKTEIGKDGKPVVTLPPDAEPATVVHELEHVANVAHPEGDGNAAPISFLQKTDPNISQTKLAARIPEPMPLVRGLSDANVGPRVLADFLSEDAIPAASKVGDYLKGIAVNAAETIYPFTNASQAARKVASAGVGAMKERIDNLTLNALDKGWERMWSRLTPDHQIAAKDILQSGGDLGVHFGDARFGAFQDFEKTFWDKTYNQLTDLGVDIEKKQNYSPSQFANDEPSFLPSIGGVGGTKAALHEASLDPFSVRIANGEVPVDTNPYNMFVRAANDRTKLLRLAEWTNGAQEIGLRQIVKEGEKPREGWVKQSEIPGASLSLKGDGDGIAYMDPDLGRLIASFGGPDPIGKSAIGKGLGVLKNLSNSFELMWPAFHFTLEANAAISSRISLAISDASTGSWATTNWSENGLIKALTDIVTPHEPVMIGNEIRRYSTSPDEWLQSPGGKKMLEKYPQFQEYVDLLRGAGQSWDIRDNLKASFARDVVSAYQDSPSVLGAPIRAVFGLLKTAIRTPNLLMFNEGIPQLKWGASFRDMASQIEAKAADLASGKITKQDIAVQTVRAFDDIMGRVSADRTFWSNTMKSALFLTYRAARFAIGDAQLIGKAAVGQVKNFQQGMETVLAGGDVGQGASEAATMDPHTRLLLGQALWLATSSAIVQKLQSDRYPWETDTPVGDLIRPRTGKTLPDGRPERNFLPSVAGMTINMVRHTPTYMGSMLAPLWKGVSEDMANKDYSNNEIYSDDDGFTTKWFKMIKHAVAPNPIAFATLQKQNPELSTAGTLQKALTSVQGLTGTRTGGWDYDKTNFMKAVDNVYFAQPRPARSASKATESQLIIAMIDKAKTQGPESIRKDLDENPSLSENGIKRITEAVQGVGLQPYEYRFKHLESLKSKLRVLNEATPEELQHYLPYLRSSFVSPQGHFRYDKKTGQFSAFNGLTREEIPAVTQRLSKYLPDIFPPTMGQGVQ